MKFGIKTLDDVDFKGKTVLLRVDINEPIDKSTDLLKDITRIVACIPTIKELSDGGAKLVILAHQGSDIEHKNFYTTKPHSKILEQLLNKKVDFIEDICGPYAIDKIKSLQNGEILLLDNVRFLAEEQTLWELNLKLSHEQQAKTLLVRKLAPLADLYICDAFAAAHRDQPSLCGFSQVLPSAMGRLFEKEYCVISNLMENPNRKCIFVLGGAKISDAFLMMKTVLNNGVADEILTGGLVSNILLWANGTNIGDRSKDFIIKQGYESMVDIAKGLLQTFADKIILPIDLASIKDDKRLEYDINLLPNDEMLIDIGSKTANCYDQKIKTAKTVFVNGPMGVFENPLSEDGTKIVWNALKQTKSYTVIGGGDSITATNKYNATDKIDYICTGGGALIRFLTGEQLPVVKALIYGAKI